MVPVLGFEPRSSHSEREVLPVRRLRNKVLLLSKINRSTPGRSGFFYYIGGGYPRNRTELIGFSDR
jgi:hypothetical protein